jgi:hypothetical protein
MSKSKQSRSVYFREAYLWDKIAKAAADQNRSVNNYIETILAAHLLNESLKK